jgi:hypothetical protein
MYFVDKKQPHVMVPCGVTSINDCEFWNSPNLTSIVIPKTVSSIGNCAFYGCSKLANLTIPGSMVKIGTSAFFGCSSLSSIVFLDSFSKIEEWAFSYCHADLTFWVSSGENFDECQKRFPHFVVKYNNMEWVNQKTQMLKNELIEKYMHPRRVERFLEQGGDLDDY